MQFMTFTRSCSICLNHNTRCEPRPLQVVRPGDVISEKHLPKFSSFSSVCDIQAVEMDVCGNMHQIAESPASLPDEPSTSGAVQAGGELNDYLVEFFKNCDPAFIEEDTSFLTECLRDHHAVFKCLGDDIYLMAGVFQKNVTVQIRKFVSTPQGQVATRSGVVFTFPAWYQFCDKVYHFNMKYSAASFICDNSLLVLSSNGAMILRELKTSKFLILNSDHLRSITELLPTFNDELLKFMYERYLPAAIATMVKPSSFYNEQTSMQEARLIAHVEHELSSILQTVYPCFGCQTDNNSQRRHQCLMLSNAEKYAFVGNVALLLVNIPDLAGKIVSDLKTVSLDFLSNLNVNTICDSVFKSL